MDYPLDLFEVLVNLTLKQMAVKRAETVMDLGMVVGGIFGKGGDALKEHINTLLNVGEQ